MKNPNPKQTSKTQKSKTCSRTEGYMVNIQSQDFVSELPTASGPESWEGCSLQFIRHVAWDFQLLPTQTEHGTSYMREGSMMGRGRH